MPADVLPLAEIVRIQAEHIQRLNDDITHERIRAQRYLKQLDEAYDLLLEQKVLINAYEKERRALVAIHVFKRVGKNIALAIGHVRGMFNFKSL